MRARPILAALLISLFGLAPSAAAQTPPSHDLTLILAGKFNEPGHIPIPPPDGEFEDACGAALNGEGNIFVADYYHRLIYVYEPGPVYVEQFPIEDPDGPCNLAFDGEGNLYVNDWHRNVVRYEPGGGQSVIDSVRSTGVTYDPASDRVYVDDRTYIAVYEPSGAPVLVGGLPLRIGLGSLESGYGVAVSDYPDTEGDVYVADAAAGLVRVYGPAGEELAPIDGLGTPQHGFSSLADSNVLITPADGHLYVADDLEPGFEHPAAAVDEFNPAGEYRGQLPHALIAAEPSALALGPAGQVYVTSGNDEKAALYGFGPTFLGHRLAVSITGAGAGSVTSGPAGINCPGACAAEYNAGEEVILTAVAQAGSVFSGWSGGGCSGTSLCHTTLSDEESISAEFSLAPLGPSQSAALAPAVAVAPTAPIAAAAAQAPWRAPARRHRRRHHRAHRERER